MDTEKKRLMDGFTSYNRDSVNALKYKSICFLRGTKELEKDIPKYLPTSPPNPHNLIPFPAISQVSEHGLTCLWRQLCHSGKCPLSFLGG